MAAAERAHDAHRHRLPDAVGIADREDHVADPRVLDASERDDRQVLQVDLQHREIGLGIAADDRRLRRAAVGELHLDLLAALDHVLVREDVAVLADDDAGREGLREIGKAIRRPARTRLRERIARRAALSVDVDADDRRGREHDRVAVRIHPIDPPAASPERRQRSDLADRHVARRAAAFEPIGTQRPDDEQKRHAHRHRLREEQPQASGHRSVHRAVIARDFVRHGELRRKKKAGACPPR